MYPVPDKTEANKIITNSIPKIEEIASHIKIGEILPEENLSLADRMMPGIVNGIFYSFFVNAKGFYVTEKCNGCGKCADLCPLNNVEIVNVKPVWGNNCTHCMACICACPQEAVEYKKRSKGKPRYYIEEN